MGILNVDLYKISLVYTNYNEDAPETITHIGLLASNIKFEKLQALKKI